MVVRRGQAPAWSRRKPSALTCFTDCHPPMATAATRDPELIKAEEAIPAALHASTRVLIERFTSACDTQALRFEARHYRAIVTTFCASPFLAEVAIADPGWFIAELLTADVGPRGPDFYRTQLGEAIKAGSDEAATFRAIRQFRNRELARIAWRDIRHQADVLDITTELTALADACIHCALQWSTDHFAARFGVACGENGEPMDLCIVGMGKLGAGELNFSSDIDLIFAYPSAGTTHGGRREISHQEYFDKLGKQFIALLNEQTADGFVFRVDMRLRPFGDSGPLTSSFDSLEHYYQLHGRDWERYAFIKARVITGRDEDRARLEALFRPFVYRRYIDFGALEAVREMKALITAEAERANFDDNIKLGAGGIREIEFIGQTFQLIRGGREVTLRTRRIIEVLGAIADLGLLPRDDTDALENAYRFLRRTEHRLQQVHDRQTHMLPDAPLERARLAVGMAYPSYEEFAVALESHRERVRSCFAALLTPVATEHDDEGGPESPAHSLWHAETLDRKTFSALGFDDPDACAKVIEHLKNPRFLERLSREARTRLDRLMPSLIEVAGQRSTTSDCLGRLSELVQSVARRSVYLSLLAENPASLERLVDLFAASPWIARQITQQPALLDELLDPRILYAPPDRASLFQQLRTRLGSFDSGDLERVMDGLRNFKNQQVLRVAASDMMGQFPVADVSNQLSYIAEALLSHALDAASAILTEKHGAPRCVSNRVERHPGFAIIAYGKLGGLELGYGSDLDLVFIHDSDGDAQSTAGPRAIDNNLYFTRLTQRIIHIISTRTGAGRVYEIDTRLRPSGSSGLLVSSLAAFARYQKTQAWTWEHQALIRARAVAGAPQTIAAFDALRHEILLQARDQTQLADDIAHMRERMRGELDRSDSSRFDLKQGRGGITDIEFMVQYGVLRWAHDHPSVLEYTDNLRLLERFTDLGLITSAMGNTLHDAYFAYRAAVHRAALQEIDSLVDGSDFADHRQQVTKFWQEFIAPT